MTTTPENKGVHKCHRVGYYFGELNIFAFTLYRVNVYEINLAVLSGAIIILLIW